MKHTADLVVKIQGKPLKDFIQILCLQLLMRLEIPKKIGKNELLMNWLRFLQKRLSKIEFHGDKLPTNLVGVLFNSKIHKMQGKIKIPSPTDLN